MYPSTDVRQPFGGDANRHSRRGSVAQSVDLKRGGEREGCGSSPMPQSRSRHRLWWMISGAAPCATKSVAKTVESLRLPKGWQSYVRNAVLNVVGIVRIAMLAGREALINNGDVNDARIHQLECEVAMLREELRINGVADAASRPSPASPMHNRGTAGHPGTRGHAGLEQSRNGPSFLPDCTSHDLTFLVTVNRNPPTT